MTPKSRDGRAGTYGIPDPADEHVVATAVAANAGAIITQNLRDFPDDTLPVSVRAIAPAAFALDTVSLDPVRSRAAVSAIAAQAGRGPPLTKDLIGTP